MLSNPAFFGSQVAAAGGGLISGNALRRSGASSGPKQFGIQFGNVSYVVQSPAVISFWFLVTGAGHHPITAVGTSPNPGSSDTINIDSATRTVRFVASNGAPISSGQYPLNVWNRVVINIGSGGSTLTLNGSLQGSNTNATAFNARFGAYVGSVGVQSESVYLSGLLVADNSGTPADYRLNEAAQGTGSHTFANGGYLPAGSGDLTANLYDFEGILIPDGTEEGPLDPFA